MLIGQATAGASVPSPTTAADEAAGTFVPVAILVAYDVACDPLPAASVALRQLGQVVLVDNSPLGHPALCGPHEQVGLTVISNGNRGGLAGAYNAALEWIRQRAPQATHVLFLDDDSDPAAIAAFLASPATRAILQDPKFAAVAPMYRERATGLRGAHLQLERWRWRVLPRDVDLPQTVSFLINSMSLWRLSALATLGPYAESLGVDHIDTDMCLRAKVQGFSLALNAQIEFWHTIGRRRGYRLLGRSLQTGGHNAARRRSIAKNTVVLAKSYGWRFPAFAALCVVRLVYEAVGICLAEDGKPGKLAALAGGACAGAFSPAIRCCPPKTARPLRS